MTGADPLLVELSEHCLGESEASMVLLRTGAFPDGWCDRYILLLDKACERFGKASVWPRELAAAAYVVSVYYDKRYRDWQRFTGGSNPHTESQLVELRHRGDGLMIAWHWRQGTSK